MTFNHFLHVADHDYTMNFQVFNLLPIHTNPAAVFGTLMHVLENIIFVFIVTNAIFYIQLVHYM